MRSAWAAAILAVTAFATGCASCEDVHCSVPKGPEFGAGTRRFLADVASLPEWTANEFDERGDRLAAFGHRFWARREREVELTGDRIVDLGPAIARDLEEHGGEAVDFVARYGQRAGKDACCFIDRFWHTFKIVARP